VYVRCVASASAGVEVKGMHVAAAGCMAAGQATPAHKPGHSYCMGGQLHLYISCQLLALHFSSDIGSLQTSKLQHTQASHLAVVRPFFLR